MNSRNWSSGWGLVALWLLTAVIVLLLQSWLFEASFLGSLASLPLLLVFGIGLLVLLLATKAWWAAMALAAGAALVAVLPLNALGHQAWTRISFTQHRAAYEKIVAQTPRLADRGTIDGEAYLKDGERVAFPRSQGMPDGWSAVVYDSTNAMPVTDDAGVPAFGSNIRSCIQIEQDWYRCWFD